MEDKIKELFKCVVIGFASVFIISLLLNSFVASFVLTLTYMFFVYLPFLPLIIRLKINFVEKYVLSHLAGLSYAAVYVLIDVVFKIPLAKFVFFITTVLIVLLTFTGYLKDFF